MAITPAHSAEQAKSTKARQAILSIRTDRQPGYVLPLLLAGVPATIFYAWFITNGTFNFFGPERHGLAYGSLLLHMLHGSLQVDRSAIGLEGIFINEKIYMYYGILPALLRLPFVPFVDLAQTTVSRFIVLFLTVSAAGIWHYLLLRTLEPYRFKLARFSFGLCLLVTALIAWLISPSYALCATATIYHEPVAAALLLTAMFTLVVRQGMEHDGRISEKRIILLAIIAALSVHTRPTVAVGLYLGTALYIMLGSARIFRRDHLSIPTMVHSARLAGFPTLVLAISGALFLWLNWVRWGAPFTPAPSRYWGYHLFVFIDGFNGGSTNTLGGTFNALRIPANLVSYFLSNKGWTADVAHYFGTGIGRMVEPDSPMLLLWLVPILIACFGLCLRFFSPAPRKQINPELLILAIALGTPALMLLSYPTINYRYKLLLWPILFIATLFGSHEMLARAKHFTVKMLTAYLLAFTFLCAVTIVDTSRVNTYYKLFRGLNDNDTRSAQNFFLTQLLISHDKLSEIHVMSVDELADLERRLMAR